MEFSESIKKAKIKRKKELLDIIFKASRRTWQAGAWYLERVYPDEFGRKKIQEANTNESLINLIQSLTSE